MSARPHLFRSVILAAALGAMGPAAAHHPGSHAYRQPDGRVRVEAVAQATDACIRIGSIRAGAPDGLAPVPGSAAVTARLERQGEGACAAIVTAVRAEALLDLDRSARQVLLYILAPDGKVAATERLQMR
ncbi:MAG TPA: hypothetical protein VHL98_04560 [Microvirga sp.]|jgi:hypothetical protein|nr:hypothetical protein [Microvirga sp.]